MHQYAICILVAFCIDADMKIVKADNWYAQYLYDGPNQYNRQNE